MNMTSNKRDIRARILNSRLLGNISQIRLALEEVDTPTDPLLARTHGVFLPAHDTVVSITVEEEKTFIFPVG